MYYVSLSKNISTDTKGYQHLIDVYDNIMAQGDKDATLVFDRCVHIDANLSAMLGSLLDDLKVKGYNLWLTHPKSDKVRDNLSRNNFRPKIAKLLNHILNPSLCRSKGSLPIQNGQAALFRRA